VVELDLVGVLVGGLEVDWEEVLVGVVDLEVVEGEEWVAVLAVGLEVVLVVALEVELEAEEDLEEVVVVDLVVDLVVADLAAALVAGLVADFLERIKMLLFQIIYYCYLSGFGGGTIC
jgi:hypothetical protein